MLAGGVNAGTGPAADRADQCLRPFGHPSSSAGCRASDALASLRRSGLVAHAVAVRGGCGSWRDATVHVLILRAAVAFLVEPVVDSVGLNVPAGSDNTLRRASARRCCSDSVVIFTETASAAIGQVDDSVEWPPGAVSAGRRTGRARASPAGPQLTVTTTRLASTRGTLGIRISRTPLA